MKKNGYVRRFLALFLTDDDDHGRLISDYVCGDGNGEAAEWG